MRPVHAGSSSRPSPPKLTIAEAPLPTGFDQPATLVGDPAGRGAYFLAESSTDARVFHWDGRSLSSWSVGNPTKNIDFVTGIQNAIVAGLDGAVWIGTGSSLIELPTTSGKSVTIRLPAATNSTSTDERRPVELRGYHPVTAMALAPNGDVAVIRDAARDVEICDHSTGKFSRVALSSAAQPTSIAYDEAGVLAVGGNSPAVTTAINSQGVVQVF